MEKRKVYIVYANHWEDGDTACEDFTDSVWSHLDDAKRRIKELANEYVRQEWYGFWAIPDEDYTILWENDNETVRIGQIGLDEECYYIMTQIVDPVLKDFEGP